jgi:hypothetical protein
MPASASAAIITPSSICSDAVGFAEDESAAANVIPGAGWFGNSGRGLHIRGVCTLIGIGPPVRGYGSRREHVRADGAPGILNGWP